MVLLMEGGAGITYFVKEGGVRRIFDHLEVPTSLLLLCLWELAWWLCKGWEGCEDLWPLWIKSCHCFCDNESFNHAEQRVNLQLVLQQGIQVNDDSPHRNPTSLEADSLMIAVRRNNPKNVLLFPSVLLLTRGKCLYKY